MARNMRIIAGRNARHWRSRSVGWVSLRSTHAAQLIQGGPASTAILPEQSLYCFASGEREFTEACGSSDLKVTLVRIRHGHARKLLIYANTVVQRGTPWVQKPAAI